jgi:hypothetical protein
VLFDLRGAPRASEALVRLRRTRPRAPVLAIAATPPEMRAAFEAGALAVVPADHDVIAAGYRSLLRQRHDFGPEVASAGTKQGLAKLRSILPDLRHYTTAPVSNHPSRRPTAAGRAVARAAPSARA